MTRDADIVTPTATVRVRVEDVAQVLEQAPKIGYFRIRDYLGRCFGRFRVDWLREKGTRFGRGGQGIKVSQLNETARKDPLPKEVLFRVQPEAKRMPTPQAAASALNLLVAEVGTGNEVLQVHQFGGNISAKSRRGMFVPVRTRPGDFKLWRAKNPGKALLFLPSKRDDKTLVYEKVGKRRPRLRLRFLVAKGVTMKRTLRLYEAWDETEGLREAFWAQAATAMERDLNKRDPRDF